VRATGAVFIALRVELALENHSAHGVSALRASSSDVVCVTRRRVAVAGEFGRVVQRVGADVARGVPRVSVGAHDLPAIASLIVHDALYVYRRRSIHCHAG
jgi:hypothetical protein